MKGAVHSAQRHDSALKHVTGQALYIDDMLEPPGTLHAALVLSPVASGRLRNGPRPSTICCRRVRSQVTFCTVVVSGNSIVPGAMQWGEGAAGAPGRCRERMRCCAWRQIWTSPSCGARAPDRDALKKSAGIGL